MELFGIHIYVWYINGKFINGKFCNKVSSGCSIVSYTKSSDAFKNKLEDQAVKENCEQFFTHRGVLFLSLRVLLKLLSVHHQSTE